MEELDLKKAMALAKKANEMICFSTEIINLTKDDELGRSLWIRYVDAEMTSVLELPNKMITKSTLLREAKIHQAMAIDEGYGYKITAVYPRNEKKFVADYLYKGNDGSRYLMHFGTKHIYRVRID